MYYRTCLCNQPVINSKVGENGGVFRELLYIENILGHSKINSIIGNTYLILILTFLAVSGVNFVVLASP